MASTKAFTAQVAVLSMLAIELGRRRHMSAAMRPKGLSRNSRRFPRRSNASSTLSDHISDIAAANIEKDNWLFLGRGFNYPVALEGALKLKEISYIHAEGLPGGRDEARPDRLDC